MQISLEGMFEENLTSFSCKMNIFESKVNYLFLGKVNPKGILKITPKVNELQNFNVNLLENFLLSLHDVEEEGVWNTSMQMHMFWKQIRSILFSLLSKMMNRHHSREE